MPRLPSVWPASVPDAHRGETGTVQGLASAHTPSHFLSGAVTQKNPLNTASAPAFEGELISPTESRLQGPLSQLLLTCSLTLNKSTLFRSPYLWLFIQSLIHWLSGPRRSITVSFRSGSRLTKALGDADAT